MNPSKIQLSFEDILLEFNQDTLRYSIDTGKTKWETRADFSPYIVLQEKKVNLSTGAKQGNEIATVGKKQDEPARSLLYFKDAKSKSHELIRTGVGEGIRSIYKDFILPSSYSSKKEELLSFSFESYVWIEYSTKQVYFEWIPLTEASIDCIDKILFPGPFAFHKESSSWYSIIPKEQGILIPNTWDVSFHQDGFKGRFGTASAYLPIFGQVKDGEGYLAESLTPWNMGYEAVHEAGSMETSVEFRIEPSLGQMEYRRIMRYLFLSNCDYNSLLKTYRKLAREEGKLKTLKD